MRPGEKLILSVVWGLTLAVLLKHLHLHLHLQKQMQNAFADADAFADANAEIINSLAARLAAVEDAQGLSGAHDSGRHPSGIVKRSRRPSGSVND
jgi:hypothetical protein